MSDSFKLKNGSILLSTEAPGGIYNASQLKKLAAICDGDSVIVKATEDQRLALLVSPDKASAIADELKAIGLGIRHYQNGLHQPVSCIGQMCEDHEQDALGSALDISAEIEGIKLESPLKIGINGCAKCCVPCHTLDISVVGDSSGYRVSLGGKNSQLPEMASFMAEGVPAEEMPRLMKNIIELYKERAQPGESLQELIDRDGASGFVSVLAPWSQDAADTSDPFAPPASADATPSMETQDEEPAAESAVETAEDQGDDLNLDEIQTSDSQEESMDLDIATSTDSEMSQDLDPIPVSAGSEIGDIDVPINTDSNDVPEINMREAELDIEDSLPDAGPIEQDASMPNSGHDEITGLDEAESDHLQEVAIDAGDVLRAAPIGEAQTPQPGSAIADTTTSSDMEMSGDDEDATEARLTEGLTAQGEIMNDDPSEQDREAGTELLESAEISLNDAQEELSDMQPDLIPEDTNEDSGFEEVSDEHDSASHDDQQEFDSDHEDDHFDVHDHLPLSEVVATRKIYPGKNTQPKKMWTIASFDMDDLGNPVITWTNGASLTLTPEAIANGTLKFGGHELRISPKDSGIQVEVDGLKLFLPVAA